ncbi:MAG: hypothetical protein A3H97_11015 [Acidobacteria bacterium RIFCSPLOWO2_02_FULL_65_29]|nr:MAG: hypothetical protein A3H97_11015 [Acidobacteria bacterium RIFCSPLOWO2_02_FULL_65_29]
MKSFRPAVAALAAVVAVGSWAIVASGQAVPLPSQVPLPLEPLGLTNEAVFAALEGWGPHKDGANVIILGYFNRNKDQELDIPIGPNNRIEPGGPDFGQPTHFETGRAYGVFSIPVAKEALNRKLTWTINANGQTTAVTFWANPAYWIDFFQNTANENAPPVIKFAENGPTTTGPPRGIAQTLTGAPWQPVELRFWASDKPAKPSAAEAARGAAPARGADAGRGRGARGPAAPDPGVAIIGGQVIASRGGGGGGGGGGRGSGPPADIRISWHKHRGPGDVTYDTDEIRLENKGDATLFLEAKTNAYFSEPGEYILRAQVNDQSGNGGGGDQCCWTTALVRVNIK